MQAQKYPDVVRLRLPLLLALASTALTVPAALAGTGYAAQRVCRFQDSRIGESSGLASSSFSDSRFWTHNDSGDTGRFFLVDTPSCKTAASYSIAVPPSIQIPGVGESLNNLDIEDIARGRTPDGKPTLLLADIGDNQQVRNVHVVTELLEPDGKSSSPGTEQSVMPLSIHVFAWAGTAWDAESVAILPDRRLVVVTKPRGGSGLDYTGKSEIYVSAAALGTGLVDIVQLQKVADLDLTVLTKTKSGEAIAATAADISQDGRSFVVRTYTKAFEWALGKDGDIATAIKKRPTVINLLPTKQGEAIAYSRNGKQLWTSSEGSGTDSNKASGVIDRYSRR